MKIKSLIVVLSLLTVGLQTSWSQERGMKVWHNGTSTEFPIHSIDSIQFVNLATNVILSHSEIALEIGNSMKLTATVYPENASKILAWSSTNANIASVGSDGTVTALSDGKCTIKCRAVDSDNVYAECLVEVGNTDSPSLTCAKAVELVNAMADGATSAETYSITGYITEVIGTVSRNQQSFWMADTKDGGKVFEAYWANLPEGVTEFKAGSKVKITGQLLKYVKNGVVTPEIKNATVVILEEGEGGGDDGGGTDGTAITCAKAVELVNALADGATSTESYTVSGYITEVIGTVSRNQQSFWMADTKDGGKVFEAYWANLPKGVTEFKAGSKVKITGQLLKYVKNGVVTPEIKNATVAILEDGEGGGGEDQGGGETVTTLVNGNFESWVSDAEPTGWKSKSTASSATLSKSTDAHGGNYSCKVAPDSLKNVRLATQEITLEAGSYTFSYYAKSTTGDVSQTRPGYVPMKSDGSVGSYVYGDFASLNNSEWTLVSYSFELTEKTTLCLLVMNPKNGTFAVSQVILVDDATLTRK